MEPYLAWGLLYLYGRHILIDFLVAFGSLISICLIDVFPAVPFFYPSYEHLKRFVNSVYLFLCDFLEFMTGRIRTNKRKVKMCFFCTSAVDLGYGIPLSVTFWLELYVLQGKGRGQKEKKLSLNKEGWHWYGDGQSSCSAVRKALPNSFTTLLGRANGNRLKWASTSPNFLIKKYRVEKIDLTQLHLMLLIRHCLLP